MVNCGGVGDVVRGMSGRAADGLDWAPAETCVLEDEYGLWVPVVLLDGRERGYWRGEEDRAVRDLARPAGGGR